MRVCDADRWSVGQREPRSRVWSGFRQYRLLGDQTVQAALGKYGPEFPGGILQPLQPRAIRPARQRYQRTWFRCGQLDRKQPAPRAVRAQADVLARLLGSMSCFLNRASLSHFYGLARAFCRGAARCAPFLSVVRLGSSTETLASPTHAL